MGRWTIGAGDSFHSSRTGDEFETRGREGGSRKK